MDRRAIAEENYRKKFEDFGLSERFVFLRREWSAERDKRFWSKCKACGAEFLSYPEVFKGKQKHLLCPKCGSASDGADIWERSQRCNEAMAYYTEGHSVKQTAEKFGVSESQINNSVKNRRLTNGRQWQKARVEDQKADAERRLIKHLAEIGFEYIGGYSNKDGKVKIRCRKCGAEFERTADFLKNGNVICIECQKVATQKRKEEHRKIAEQEAEARKIEREWYRLIHPPKNAYAEQHEAFLNRTGICEICGKPYTVREFIESAGLKKACDSGVCSGECRRIKQNRSVRASRKRRGVRDNHRHRARKLGLAYDPSITLKKLVERNGLKCAICGEMCDWNDHTWSKYSGPMYPSIDHIIPMSKGGPHVWENVQVAHIICNSEKSNKFEEVV